MASWTLAELIRIFHGISTKEAQETVDALVERKIGLVWEVEEIKRVLDPNMNKVDQLLCSCTQSQPGWPNKTCLTGLNTVMPICFGRISCACSTK
jgi:hypothetical protein